MTETLVASLRSVEIGLPDVAAAEKFYTDTWGLGVAARRGSSVYLRGTGADHHLLSLHESRQPELKMVTLRAASGALSGATNAMPKPRATRTSRFAWRMRC